MSNDAAQRAFQNARLKKKRKAEADALFSGATALHQAGRIAEAAPLYRQILDLQPEHFGALHMLSLCEFGARRLVEAEQLINQALQIDPRSADAHSNLGIILFQMDRYEEARAAYRRAIALKPRYAVAFNNLGNACKELGLLDEALESYDKAIALKADYANCHGNRGLLLAQLKRWEDAIASYDRAILFDGRNADALSNRGNALLELIRPAEALASYDRALAYRPDMPEALNGRATALSDLRNHQEAFATFQRALDINPAFTQAYTNRAALWLKLSKFDEALADIDRALSHPPEFAATYVSQASALLHTNRMSEALAACQKAIALEPASYQGYTVLGNSYARMGDPDTAVESYDKALAIRPNFPEAIGSRIFALDFVATSTVAQQQQARTLWWEQIGARLAARAPLAHGNARDPQRRLKIGYVSSDFRSHSAAFAFRPVLQNHDKQQFEIICYSCSSSQDSVTDEFRVIADRWHDAGNWSDDMMLKQIAADGIDILVDLSGHSDGNRLGVFARKPAPVQVTAWGHASGTGLPTIDYLFSDPVAIPAEVRSLYAETVWDLPCVVTLEPLPDSIARAEPPALRNGYLTFGTFNRISKLSNDAIAVWSTILQKLPTARMLIKDFILDDPAVRDGLLARFAACGVTADRLLLLGRSSRPEHLEKLNEIDICLDPFPQNGGVSTWEALQMGVPVVALLGTTLPSRVAAAILASIDMPDWIAADADAYVDIAVSRGQDVQTLTEMRRDLPGRILASAAGNPVLYTQAVEAAYQAMWQTWCAAAANPDTPAAALTGT